MVEAGDVVAVVESMKLETALRAPVPGRVREVLVAPNTQVEGGTKLVRLEPDAATTRGSAATGSTWPRCAGGPAGTDGGPAAVAADALSALRHLVLGYDIDEREARPLLAALAAARDELPARRPGRAGRRDGRDAASSPTCASLSRNRRGADGRAGDTGEIDPAGEEARNPQEYLYAYLRSRDADAEGLPESFRARLRGALAHYGVPDLEPSDELGRDRLSSALYRMFLAHRRAAAHVPVLLELLQWRLRNPESLPESSRARRTGAPSTSWSGPPSCGTRWSAGWPAGCATPASTRR